MKILYFDCFSGISGDMTLGALLDLGLDVEAFRAEMEKLGLRGYSIAVGKAVRYGISCTDADVRIDADDGHEHEHDHERNLGDILGIIQNNALSGGVKTTASNIFTALADAEAKVHGLDRNEVHFHEVGAVDSIVDIVGAAVCLEMLGADRICCSALHEGSGTITCRHGVLPVPVPAVAEMLAGSGIPVVIEDVGTELVTPTGLAIIKSVASGFGKMPAMTVEKIGYGSGKRDTGRLNALRVFLGESAGSGNGGGEEAPETVEVIETNIDDMNPEIFGHVMDLLLKAGALDVSFTPVYMKKNRPAYMLTVICRPEDRDRFAETILLETTTLGVRSHPARRTVMNRRNATVETRYGPVVMKIAERGGAAKASPEYDSCRKIAEATGIPLREICAEASAAFQQNRKDPKDVKG